MSKEYFFKTQELLIWRPSGNLDINKISDFVKFLENNILEGKEDFMRFIDLSKIESISVNHEELYGIASGRRQFTSEHQGTTIKLAFFVTNALSYGMARMYENMLDNSPFDIRIYYTINEVANFLGVGHSLLIES